MPRLETGPLCSTWRAKILGAQIRFRRNGENHKSSGVAVTQRGVLRPSDGEIEGCTSYNII